MTPTIVLVHGAWHGSWCWERVAGLLAAQGLQIRTVDLPSTGGPDIATIGSAAAARPGTGAGAMEPPSAGALQPPGLAEDAAAVRAALADLGPVILCGHSYGGMVISAAGHLPQVRRLVYLCAFMPEAGESVESILAADRRAGYWMRRRGPWTVPDPARAPAVFYGDCEAAVQAWAGARLRPQSTRAFGESLEEPAWKHQPSTYVVCARDGVIQPAIQRGRLAPRAGEVVELDSAHAPFLSRPVEVAALLEHLARAGAPRRPAAGGTSAIITGPGQSG